MASKRVVYIRPKPRSEGLGVENHGVMGGLRHSLVGFDKFKAMYSEQVFAKHRGYLASLKQPGAARKRVLEDEWKALPEAAFLRFYELERGAGSWERDQAANAAERAAQKEAARVADVTALANFGAIGRIAASLRVLTHSQLKTFESAEAVITQIVRAELKRAREQAGLPEPEAKRARASEDSQ